MNDVLREEIGDLRLFADPFEAFRHSPSVGGWTAAFVRKGEEIAVRRNSDGTVTTLRGPGQPRYRNIKGLRSARRSPILPAWPAHSCTPRDISPTTLPAT